MAGRGPLPDPNAERRNAPTIPTTNLPAGGRRGPIPEPPGWVELGKAGLSWWQWAWRTPQAVAWSVGDEVVIARRALLEDDLNAAQAADFGDFLKDVAYAEDLREIKGIVTRLAALVTNRLQIVREQREIEDRLGLTPKGLASLRWKIVADDSYYPPTGEPAKKRAATEAKVTELSSRRARLSED
jgi:hypothetical protein